VLRIKNIIKRNAGAELVNRSLVTLGDVQFYKDSLKLVIAGRKEIILTPREAELLNYLFCNENRILKREEILTQLWEKNDYFLGRSLDVFVSRLRKHLNASNCISIDNVYGVVLSLILIRQNKAPNPEIRGLSLLCDSKYLLYIVATGLLLFT